jgi:uncharacterized protein (TIGR00297 family)
MYYTELFAQFFALTISIFAWRKRSVSLSGFISMLVISSFFIWNNGIAALLILFGMFASASLLTKYKTEYKSVLTDKVVKKHGPRDAVQALCNLGIAFFCFLFYTYNREEVWLLALLCSVASSNADSWASELGILSKKKPVLITNFKICKPGISGGITWFGSFAGIMGSIFIALLSLLLKEKMMIGYSIVHLFFLVSLAGIAGLFMDSLLGATLQIVYKDDKGEETENVPLGLNKSRGLRWINNDGVNFLSSMLVALTVYLLYSIKVI